MAMPIKEISTLFLEHGEHILLVNKQKKGNETKVWTVPGVKKSDAEALLRKMSHLGVNLDSIVCVGQRNAEVVGKHCKIHIYHTQLDDKPKISIPSKMYSDYAWVSIYAFKTMPLSKGQGNLFDVVYGGRIWQRVKGSQNESEPLKKMVELVLKKGENSLVFNKERRFIINLIGTAGSGKGTQSSFLSKIYGVPAISPGDLFRSEFKSKSKLSWMMEAFHKEFYPEHFPEEVAIGMMTRRLSENDCSLGFLFDGFPKTEVQTKVAYEVFLKKDDFHVPLFMDVPESEVVERFSSRFICPECTHQVRQFDENPWPGFCPLEAKEGKMIQLEQRHEDQDSIAMERKLELFRSNKQTILEAAGKRDRVWVFRLDNQTPPIEVLHRLSGVIQQRLDKLAKDLADQDSS